VKAAIYARVSSLGQRDKHTIASQLSTLPAFVASRGWELVGTYVDDGKTAKAGHLEKRDGFAKLLADMGARKFDVVVVVDQDRLTRSEDLRERGEVLGAFQRAGVQLAIASSGQLLDLGSSMGDLLSGLQAFFSAEENRKRRERSLRGKDEAARQGRKPGGITPFGYVYTKAERLADRPGDDRHRHRDLRAPRRRRQLRGARARLRAPRRAAAAWWSLGRRACPLHRARRDLPRRVAPPRDQDRRAAHRHRRAVARGDRRPQALRLERRQSHGAHPSPAGTGVLRVRHADAHQARQVARAAAAAGARLVLLLRLEALLPLQGAVRAEVPPAR
jgi:DNA invertase Pin-like site-specific DNA recombinase